jgi:hypothetical protein
MKRVMTVVAALIGSVLVMSAVAGAAKPDLTAKAVARAQCKAEKQADKAAFKAMYKSDMGTCINGAKEESADELTNASQECRAERDADEALFDETYGANKNGKNAFGKCVSGKVKAEQEEDVETFANAAQDCRAERDADKDAFQAAYGANKNGKNAFGKCVSGKVKTTPDDDETEEEGETIA